MYSKYKYRILSISFASYTSIFLALIPVIYVSNDFTTSQIAFLSSMYTFGAIVQPLFSSMTNKLGIRKTLTINLLITLVSTAVLLISTNYFVYAVFVTLYYIFQAPNIGLIDNLLKLISEQKDISFGNLRAFISAGWGIGTIIVLPFMIFLDNKIILIVVMLFIVLTIFGISTVDVNEDIVTTKTLDLRFLSNKDFLKIFLISTMVMGAWSIKSSFQTLLLIEKTSIAAIISIVSVISILMELLIIPRVEILYKKFGYKKLLVTATLAGIILTFSYYAIDSILLIILVASLHGVVCGIMIPLNVFKIREVLDLKFFNTAMLTLYSVQNLFAFLVITLVINKLYVNYNVEVVYLSLSVILILAGVISLFITFDNCTVEK